MNSLKLRLLKFVLFAAIALTFQLTSHAQSLSINEFIASNSSTISDEDGDYEDWIELYNYGNEPVQLEGWSLSDDYSNPYRWVFPDTIIQPGEFLLVWASGKDRKEDALHTNFSIDASGEELLLIHPLGNWVDVVNPIVVPTDISYGRLPDGTGDWFYFDTPTPGISNTTEGFYDILPPPVFSHSGGFYDEEFLLEITHPDSEAVIYYTLDGSEPDPENTNGVTYFYKNKYAFHAGSATGELLEQEFRSHEYVNALPITDRSSDPNKLSQMSSTVQEPYYFPKNPVFKGTVIRARAIKEGYLPSELKTHTYFVTENSGKRYSLPIISIAIQEDSFFDYEKGIYTAGIDADKWREQNPDITFTWPFVGNFQRRGFEWENPANFEYFENNDVRSALNQQVGVRIHGGATRSYPMKSLRIYARNLYGESHLNYPFFENNPHESFKRINLRNSGNDFPTPLWEPGFSSKTLFRDAAIQKIVKHLHIDTQDYSPVIVFINGEYWGITNIRERYDKHYLERVYGVPSGNIDLLSGHGGVVEGSNVFYNETFSFIQANDLQMTENYEFVKTRIDINNFIDYQIANIFSRNTDWPGNNVDYWRLRTSDYMPDAPYGHDGRLRWLLYDTDFGFGLWGGSKSWEHNTLDFATQAGNTGWPNPDWGTFFLRNLLKNQEFRYQFINRFSDLLNTSFLPGYINGIVNGMRKTLSPEIEEHISRWRYPENKERWKKNVDVMNEFARNRPVFQRNHIRGFFDLQGTYSVEFDVSNSWHGHIKINTIEIKSSTAGVSDEPYPWKGIYFQEIPITVAAIPAPGYRFSHWEGDYSTTDSIITITPTADIKLKAHFINTGQQQLLNFWMFDNRLANNLPLQEISAAYNLTDTATLYYQSCLPGYPYDPSHDLWRMGSLERRNNPTAMNYRMEGNNNILYGDSDMRGLQVKQPLAYGEKESALIFHVPAIRVKDLVFSFSAMDEGAADALVIDYSVDGTRSWTNEHLISDFLDLTDQYKFYEIDFSHIDQVNGNPDLYIRIRFSGSSLYANNGNRVTFNNFSLDGEICRAYCINAVKNGPGSISPAGKLNLAQCATQKFVFTPSPNHVIIDVTMDGKSIMDEVVVHEDHTGYFFLHSPLSDHELKVFFEFDPFLIHENEDIIVYPNPFAHFVNIASVSMITEIEIFDLRGSKVFSSDFSHKQIELDLFHLIPGLYIARIKHKNGVASRKLQILRE